MMATEMAPLAKVGGLADVVGALAPALTRLGHDVRVILPQYASIDTARHKVTTTSGIRRLELATGGAKVPVYLVENAGYFGRPGIYNDPADGKGYPDNAERFIFFQRAALGMLKTIDFKPDVIHCHDHQTGLVPAYLKLSLANDPFYRGIGVLFTVHNLGYQGLFPPQTIEAAGFDRSLIYPLSPFEFWGKVNFMKVGLCLADIITTVSPTYAAEIRTAEQGCGLEGVLQARSSDLHGVLNGIDDTYWNPEKDPHLKNHYTARNLMGKSKCRTELLKAFGLTAGKKRVPVIGIISRLTGQKGFDLIAAAFPTLMQRDLKLVVLGSGEEPYVKLFQEAHARHPEKVGARIGFDEALAHLIEAGADMFLMPSRYEPCGLNQMYSLAYGTVPIVRATGGLADTVREGGEKPNGFVFHEYDASHMMAAIDRALEAFEDKKDWKRLMLEGLSGDYSWSRSARIYSQLFEETAARASGARREASSVA